MDAGQNELRYDSATDRRMMCRHHWRPCRCQSTPTWPWGAPRGIPTRAVRARARINRQTQAASRRKIRSPAEAVVRNGAPRARAVSTALRGAFGRRQRPMHRHRSRSCRCALSALCANRTLAHTTALGHRTAGDSADIAHGTTALSLWLTLNGSPLDGATGIAEGVTSNINNHT